MHRFHVGVFLAALPLFLGAGVAAESPFYVTLTSQLRFSVASGVVNASQVTPTLETNIRHFLTDTANARCAGTCSVASANVTITLAEVDGNYTFSLTGRIDTRDAAASLSILAGGNLFPAEIKRSWDQAVVTDTATVFATAQAQTLDTVEESTARPVFCGDGVVGAGEQCDDFNAASGDGCSATCQLEPGYMCQATWRDPDAPSSLGLRVSAVTVGGVTTYTLTSEPEACAGSDICLMGGLWQPELWPYTGNVSLPPRGYYCTDYCSTFPTPVGLQVNTLQSDTLDTCALKDVDECMYGLAICDFHSYCENKAYNATTGLGYSCYCDAAYFPTDTDGGACSEHGFEIVVQVAGKDSFDPNEVPLGDMAVMQTVREALVDKLLTLGFFKARMTRELMLEAIHDYPPELVRELTDVGYTGRALWQFKLRASSHLVDVVRFASSTFFSDVALLEQTLTDTSATPGAYKLYKEPRCSNEVNRRCTQDSDCLNGGTCNPDTPSVTVTALDSGGSSAPIHTESSGMTLVSLAYDNSQTGWNARIRYTPSDDAVALLYLPRVGTAPTAEQMAGFFPDEFPCLPLNTGAMQQRRDSTVCCLATVDRDYTTTQAFADYVNNTDYALAREIHAQGKCQQRGDAPSNPTQDLLNGTLDFVTGTFRGMSRSTATLDTVPTIGYQDILVFIAYEDILTLGGIETKIAGGSSLRFFLGMAQLRLTATTFLSASVSAHEVTSDITNTYTFSTAGTTEFTFVREVTTDLIEIINKTSSQTLKFVRVMVGVPGDVTHDDLHGLLPVDGIIARIGYTKDTAAALQTYYPCISMYTGAPKAEIDTLLAEQAYCAFQDKVCEPLGPAPVNRGGMVSFILPLQGDAWHKATAGQGLLSQKVFLDFVLSIKDASGKRVVANVETQTRIATEAINTMCSEQKLESSVDDMFTIDMHLGLVNSSSEMESSLVSAYDVSKDGQPVNLQRDVSSRASNVLTMVLKGKDEVFSRDYSRDYSIEVEDMISVYFLSTEKKAQVDALVAAGLAVKQETIADSVSEMSLRPTEQLLALCPLQAVKGALGCITRYEIKSRSLDIRTNSIVDIAPESPDDYATVIENAGLWTQYSLGDSIYANTLGERHADVMNQEFALNRRYRKAFMVSPVIPWRATDLRVEGFSSTLNVAQFSLSFVLLAFDQNVGISYEPTVQVSIPGSLPIEPDEFAANLELQSAISSAYAQGLGLPDSSVSIDPDSITSETVNVTDDTGRRRRLLATKTVTKYECVVKFYETATTETGESVAAQKAAEIVDVLTEAESPVADILFEKVKKAVAQKCTDCELPTKADIKPPIELRSVIKAKVRAYDSCLDPVISVDLSSIGGGTATCETRVVDGVEYTIGPRGPLNDEQWAAVGGGYDILTGDAAFSAGRKQYDFCGDMPMHWEYASTSAQATWDALKAQFATCCMCLPTPKLPKVKGDYVHTYSWAQSVDALDTLPEWKQYDTKGGKTLINPQVNTFRNAPAYSLKISKDNLPPAAWKFEFDEYAQLHFYAGTCEAGYGFVTATGGCELCPVGSWRGGDEKDRISCQTCVDAFGADSHRTTKLPGQSGGALWGSPCECDKGYYSWAEKRDDASSPTRYQCEKCPANTYKALVGDTIALCLACPEGTVSRAGSASQGDCVVPTAQTLGEYEREDHVYDSLLGLVSHTVRVQSAWTDPRPQYQDNSRRCSLAVGGLGLDCPDLSHASVYAQAVTPSTLDNQVKITALGVGDDPALPGLLMHVGDPAYPQRYRVAMQPGAGNLLMYDTWYDRVDLKETAKYVSLSLRKSYGGPRFPGFVEPVLGGVRAWPSGTKINYKLRVDVPGIDLATTSVRVVTFLTTQKLESNTDWQWILCDSQSGGPEFCQHRADPDNVLKQNFKNALVKTGTIFRLQPTASCFTDLWWLDDCLDATMPPLGDRHDDVFEWVPFADSGESASDSEYYLYTTFHYGPSRQCAAHACVETDMYAALSAHLAEPYAAADYAELRFLPGTEITVQTKTEGVVYEPLLNTSLGLLSSEKYQHPLPAGGAHAATYLELDQTTASRPCALDATGTNVECAGEVYEDVFPTSMLTNEAMNLGAFTTQYAALRSSKECCADALTEECAVEQAVCYDGFRADTAQSPRRETYAQLAGFSADTKNLHDLLYQCGAGGNETCACSSSALAAVTNTEHAYPDRGAGIDACVQDADNTLVPGGLCIDAGMGLAVHASAAGPPSSVQYALTVDDAAVDVSIDAQHTLFGQWVLANYGAWPAQECTQPRITATPCKVPGGGAVPDYVFAVALEAFRTLIVDSSAPALTGRMDAHDVLLRVHQTAGAVPVLRAISSLYAEAPLLFFDTTGGCGLTCTDPLLADLDVVGERKPLLTLHAGKIQARVPACACDARDTVPATIAGYSDGDVPSPDHVLDAADLTSCFATGTCPSQCTTACVSLALETAQPTAVHSIVYSGVYPANQLEISHMENGGSWLKYTTIDLEDTTDERVDPERVYDLPLPLSAVQSCSGAAKGCGFQTFARAQEIAEGTRTLAWLVGAEAETCAATCAAASATCDESVLYNLHTQAEAVAAIALSPLHASASEPYANVVGACTNAPLLFDGSTFTYNDCQDLALAGFGRATAIHDVDPPSDRLHTGALCHAQNAAQKLCPCSNDQATPDATGELRLPTAPEVRAYEHALHASLLTIDKTGLGGWYQLDTMIDMGADASGLDRHVTVPASTTAVANGPHGSQGARFTETLSIPTVFNSQSQGFTVAFWINVHQWSQFYYSFWAQSAADPANQWFGFDYQTATALRVHMSDNTAPPAFYQDLPDMFAVDTWVHIAWSIAPDGSWEIYQNGIRRLSLPQHQTFHHDFTVEFRNVAGYTESSLDDIRLYERVLTVTEVVEIYRGHETQMCGAACAAAMDAALSGWVPVTDAAVLGGGNLVCASASGCVVDGATYPAHTLASEAYPANATAAQAYTHYRFSNAENLGHDSRVYEVKLYTDSLCTQQIDTSSGVTFSSSWPSSESMWDGNDATWFPIPDSNFVTHIEVTFASPVLLGCAWITGLGVMDDPNNVDRHKGGVRVEALNADAVWEEIAAPVPYSDATPRSAPGFLGSVLRYPLTGLGATRSHLIKVAVPKRPLWRLSMKDATAAASAQVLNVALCSTPGCAAPHGAGRLCPREAGTCYTEAPAPHDCTQTAQRELMASPTHEIVAAHFSTVQPLPAAAAAASCARNTYRSASGECVPCATNLVSAGGDAIGCAPVSCPADSYYELDEWIVGEPGATCDQTCGAVSKQCDAVMQSSIHSAAELQALIFELIAVDCAAGDAVNHAGSPLYKTSGTCHPFTTTWTDASFTQLVSSSCSANDDPAGRPLCRCHAGATCTPCPALHSAPASSVGAQACQQTETVGALEQPACSEVELDASVSAPYVMYDLGAHRGISEVQLKPRGRCGGGSDWANLQNYEVLVSDSSTLDDTAIVCAQYSAADNAGLQYTPGGVLSKPCEVFGRYVYLKMSGPVTGALAYDEFAVIPSPFAWEDTHRYRWSANVDAFQFLTLWNAPLSAVERQDAVLDWAEYGSVEYFDYQLADYEWPNGLLRSGQTWQALKDAQTRHPLFPPGAEQPLVATFDGKEAYVQFRLPDLDAVGGVVIQPGPRYADGAWPSTWAHAWPGRVRVYSSLVDDFDAAVSSAVLLLDQQVPYEYDARGIPQDLTYTLPLPADAPVAPARFVRVVLNRCTEAICAAEDADRLEFRVGLTRCVYKCEGCCSPVALLAHDAAPWLSLAAGQTADRSAWYASQTHCPYDQGGATSFERCGERACATRAYTLVYDGGLYKLGDASGPATPRLQVRRGATTTIAWPSLHPVVVSEESKHEGLPYAHATTGTLQTTVTVPAASTLERLYYYCNSHEIMGVGVIDILPADGVPPASVTCAVSSSSFDFSAVQATFSFAPVQASTIYDATFDPTGQTWFSARTSFAGYVVGDGHLFPTDPGTSVTWVGPYAGGAFLRQVSTNARVAQQFVPWGVGTLHTSAGEVGSAELVVRRGYMGPGGAGFVERLDMPATGWDRAVTVEAELHLALKTLFREDDAYYSTWKDGRVVHLVSFVTDKLLDDSPTSTDFNWIVCGRLGQHLDAFPVPSLVLSKDDLVGQQPPDGPQQGTGVSYKTRDLFVSQGGWLPNLPSLADASCDPSSPRYASECQTSFTSTTVALGYPRCDLSASLATQGRCAYTVKDVLDHYYYNNPKRYTGACETLDSLGARTWYLPPVTANFENFLGTVDMVREGQMNMASNGGFTLVVKYKPTGTMTTRGMLWSFWDPGTSSQMQVKLGSHDVVFFMYRSASCQITIPHAVWSVSELIIEYDATAQKLYARGLQRSIGYEAGVLTELSNSTIDLETSCPESVALADIDLGTAQAHAEFRSRVGVGDSVSALKADVYGMVFFDRRLDASASDSVLAAMDTTSHTTFNQGDAPSTAHTGYPALAAFTLPCVVRPGAHADMLQNTLGGVTRNLDLREPVIKARGDTAPVLLHRQKASVCHMDLYGAQVEFDGGVTERFLPRRDMSIASNPPTGVDNRGQLPYAGYDSMACSVPMPDLVDAAAEDAYLGSTSLATALALFAGQHDCICGAIAHVYAEDGSNTTLKLERTDLAQPSGHEYVFASPLASADVASGNVLGRGFANAIASRTVFATPDLASTSYGTTTATLPAEYDICGNRPDPDHASSTNERNAHVLDGVVIPLGRTPKPTYQPPIGNFRRAVHWPRDGCSYIKPHLSVSASLATFADPDVPATKRALASVADIGVIDETASSGEFEWFYGRAHLSDAGIPEFATACVQGGDGLPVDVPCAYEATFGGLVLNADEAFLGTEFEHQFVDLVYLEDRGWRHVWFGQWKGAPSRYYVRELAAGAARHHFAAGDLLIGGREGVGTAAERCPASARYGNELGVLTWTPEITGSAANYYLYTMFMVGESEACREHACDESAVLSALDAHVARAPFPEERTPLVVMQGSRVGLKRAPTARFALEPGCFAIDAVGGASPVTYTITPDAANFAQDLADLGACTECVRGVCPASSAPCQYYDAVADTVYYSLPAFTGPTTSTVLVLTTGGATWTGVALATAGRPGTGLYVDPGWTAGDKVYTTADLQCASGAARRRSLQSLLPAPMRAFAPAARRVKARKAPPPAPVKLRVQPPSPSRKLLTVGAGAPRRRLLDVGVDKTAAGANMQREITSVDGKRAMADAVCGGGNHSVCDLVRLEVQIPRARYCDAEPELLREMERQVALMNPDGKFGFTAVSVYRPVFFSACFQSSVYMRRLLTDMRSVSVLAAINELTAGDCTSGADCQIILETQGLKINDEPLWGIETAMSLLNEPVGYRLCFGDERCNSYIEIANVTTKKGLPVIEDNSPSPWAVAAIVLAVAFVIAGAFLMKNCWTQTVVREVQYSKFQKHGGVVPAAVPQHVTHYEAPKGGVVFGNDAPTAALGYVAAPVAMPNGGNGGVPYGGNGGVSYGGNPGMQYGGWSAYA